jgi:predicted DNA-binding protein (UPF0251 family)
MTVETYLEQGLLLDQRIKYHLKKLEDLRQTAISLPSITIRKDKVQTSPSGEAPFVGALMRMEEMQEQINHDIDQLEALKKQMIEVIQQVKEDKLQMLLAYKYLDGMSQTEICNRMYISKTTIKRWFKKAIAQITLPDNAMMVKLRF